MPSDYARKKKKLHTSNNLLCMYQKSGQHIRYYGTLCLMWCISFVENSLTSSVKMFDFYDDLIVIKS